MSFIPAGEFMGQAHGVRTVTLAKNPYLPDGEYAFLEMYCNEPDCDCRKAMIQVIHNGKPASIINFGWESDDYYRQWMGSSYDDESFPSMHGASIDITSQNLLNEDAILALFNELMNDVWLEKIKNNYEAVKAAVSRKPVTKAKIGRNEPCPCGSHKKYKTCCGKNPVLAIMGRHGHLGD
jgi:hypothetical protein